MTMGMTQFHEQEKELMTEIFRLVEEQTRALESRPCDRLAAELEERSYRIRELLDQVIRLKPGNRIGLSEKANLAP